LSGQNNCGQHPKNKLKKNLLTLFHLKLVEKYFKFGSIFTIVTSPVLLLLLIIPLLFTFFKGVVIEETIEPPKEVIVLVIFLAVNITWLSVEWVSLENPQLSNECFH